MLAVGEPLKPTVTVLMPLVATRVEDRLPWRLRAAVVEPIPKVAPDVVRLGAVIALLKELVPLKVLLPDTVWLALSKSTLVLKRASATVPEVILEPLRDVRPLPLPEKLPAIAVPLMFKFPVCAVPGVVACSWT